MSGIIERILYRRIKRFDKVQDYLNGIPNINNGGCGISALAMYRWLKKNNKLEVTRFVFSYASKESFVNNSIALKEHTKPSETPTHTLLLHNGKFIDSSGTRDISDGSWIQIIDEEEFIKSALNGASWNRQFDREFILHEIEKKLGINLSDILLISNGEK